MVATDPIQGYGTVVFGPEALTAIPDIGEFTEKGGEYGLNMAIPTNDRKRLVRKVKALESREKTINCSTSDFK